MIVKEREIRVNLRNAGNDDTSESVLRAITDKMGIDYGKTVYLRGEPPNREWTNDPLDYEPTPEEIAVSQAAQVAKQKEESAKDKRIAALEAQLAALSAVPPAMPAAPKARA